MAKRRSAMLAMAVLAACASCSRDAGISSSDPASCVAAYQSMLRLGKGTPMADEPQYQQLKLRLRFEYAKARKAAPLSSVQHRVGDVGNRLNGNSKLALDLASHCMADEATSDFYEKRKGLEEAERKHDPL